MTGGKECEPTHRQTSVNFELDSAMIYSNQIYLKGFLHMHPLLHPILNPHKE